MASPADKPSLSPGTIIKGKWKAIKKIGQGAFGISVLSFVLFFLLLFDSQERSFPPRTSSQVFVSPPSFLFSLSLSLVLRPWLHRLLLLMGCTSRVLCRGLVADVSVPSPSPYDPFSSLPHLSSHPLFSLSLLSFSPVSHLHSPPPPVFLPPLPPSGPSLPPPSLCSPPLPSLPLHFSLSLSSSSPPPPTSHLSHTHTPTHPPSALPHSTPSSLYPPPSPLPQLLLPLLFSAVGGGGCSIRGVVMALK